MGVDISKGFQVGGPIYVGSSLLIIHSWGWECLMIRTQYVYFG